MELFKTANIPERHEVLQAPLMIVDRRSNDDSRVASNAAGFGAVSRNHTLIPQILPQQFPAAHRIARSIINLPT